MTERFLPNPNLPASLWDGSEQQMTLPPDLADAYLECLREAGLQELSLARDRNRSPVGGLSQEATDEHFAQAFDGSAARVLLTLLDPKGDMPRLADRLIRTLSGNHLLLIDAPCGAGAGSLTLLAGIAELRAQNLLPRQPLDVRLIGAELSEPARGYAAAMLDRIRQPLARQGIFVSESFVGWDALCQQSTTALCREVVLASPYTRRTLLLVANFSSFLVREKKRKQAEPQLNELFRYAASARGGWALWVEPQMNTVTAQGGLFDFFRKLFRTGWRSIVRLVPGSEDFMTTAAKFRDPVSDDESHRVHLAVQRVELGPSE